MANDDDEFPWLPVHFWKFFNGDDDNDIGINLRKILGASSTHSVLVANLGCRAGRGRWSSYYYYYYYYYYYRHCRRHHHHHFWFLLNLPYFHS